jgi:hypothetical protein
MSAAGWAVLLRHDGDDHGGGGHRGDGASGRHQRSRVEAKAPENRAAAGPCERERAEQRNGQHGSLVRRPRRPKPDPNRGPLACRSQQGRHHDVCFAAWASAHDRAETGR